MLYPRCHPEVRSKSDHLIPSLFPCKQLYSGLRAHIPSIHVLPEEGREQERGPLGSPGSGAPVPAPCLHMEAGRQLYCSRLKRLIKHSRSSFCSSFPLVYATESKQSICAEVLADVKIQIFHPSLKAWKERGRRGSAERYRSQSAP